DYDSTEQTINDGYGNYYLVPAGQFSMGDNYDEGNPRERPVHNVYLDEYYIGEYEVTNEEYEKFMVDEGYSNQGYWSGGGFGFFSEPLYWNDSTYNGGGIQGNEQFPVVGVSWFEAKAYSSWLSTKTGNVYRLPTEVEWEKAARGGDYLDGDDSAQVPNPINPPRRYPWGNNIDSSYANYLDSGDPYEQGLTPVGYYDGSTYGNFLTHDNSSPYGAYDMAGNVYEWCNDFYSEDYYQVCYNMGTVTNPLGPLSGSIYVIRGGAFLYETFKLRSAYRGAYYPTFRGAYIGIRCVREESVSSIGENSINPNPDNFILHHNYLNPFNPTTKIKYTVPSTSNVKMEVFNALGKVVRILVDAEKQVGESDVLFDAVGLPSGVYYYRLQAGDFTVSKKMLLLK
ncbi:SUMF1/EgtB/PvdO family nonheme iron enzyme, partial [Bacteroidota bacterium]